ncbi:MAG TPA: NAD-dependent epimerase/dehydratase family protein [Actinomycetota bacterium]|jgi:UDP-glucose 4-epimerase|nr:NAD-dependent epimerase/dehydratase family protein [Actinomycetota bacterium]
MRTLVTGGAGFVGSAVVEALNAQGHEVYVVDDLSTGKLSNLADARKRGHVQFHRFDIRSDRIAELFEQVKPEVVLNLAAQASVPRSVADPIHDAEVNTLGLLRVLDACVKADVRKVVHASSGGTIYGAQRKYPIRETAKGRPESPYGIAKRAGEDYLRFYKDKHGLDFTSLAPANIYGPRQDPHGEACVVAIFALKLVRGEQPTIYGTGEQTRDFVYVVDAADAFVKACDAASGETVNVGTGIETSINDLYERMADAAGFTGEPLRGPARAGDLKRNALDPAKAVDVLGWKPWTSLAEGLRSTVGWFQRNAD